MLKRFRININILMKEKEDQETNYSTKLISNIILFLIIYAWWVLLIIIFSINEFIKTKEIIYLILGIVGIGFIAYKLLTLKD